MQATRAGAALGESGMLKVLSEFVIRIADLAEAEGRQLRDSFSAIAAGAAMLTTAALVSVIGLGLLVYAMFEAMEDSMGPAPAALVTGLITLGISGGLGFVGWKSMGAKSDPDKHKRERHPDQTHGGGR